jgi:hypothetical protein
MGIMRERNFIEIPSTSSLVLFFFFNEFQASRSSFGLVRLTQKTRGVGACGSH